MEIITRKEALEQGLKRYFTGKPCKRGHVSERSVAAGCVSCRELFLKENKEKIAKKTKEYYQKNKDKITAYKKEYSAKNKEKIADLKRHYYQDNIEIFRVKSEQYRKENKEIAATRNALYYQKNKKKISIKGVKYREENKELLAERKRKYHQENKEVIAKKKRKYHQENKEWLNERKRKYHQENKEAIRIKGEKYRQENKEKITIAKRKYHKENPFPSFIRSSIRRVESGYVVGGSRSMQQIESDIGYTRECFKRHVESLWLDGMSWGNRSEWHIDHIIPISQFIKNGIEDIKIINSLDNLQPLWANENLSKRAKPVPKKQFNEFIKLHGIAN